MFSGINEKQMEIVYDIFLPDANFRKSDPGWPAVCLCVTRSVTHVTATVSEHMTTKAVELTH